MVPLKLLFELETLAWWISISMLDSLFLNLEINLILYLYPEKCIKFNQSEPGNLTFCAPFKIIIQKRVGGLSIFENPVFPTYYIQKEWIKQEIKSVHIGNSY